VGKTYLPPQNSSLDLGEFLMKTGHFMKSASTFALVASCTFAAGMTAAVAADLGGNCCADLEERVAELEATTAKKGNRKVSLVISGQVNRTTMYWNDGVRSNSYFGLDNSTSSSRFNISGNAKISAAYSAGYNLTIEVSDKARTLNVTQKSEDGSTKFANAGANGDHALGLRDATVWIQHERVGRFTLGRLTNSGPVTLIDLGGVAMASGAPGLVGGGILLRKKDGTLSNVSIGDVTDNKADENFRTEGLKWTSPTLNGFVVSATLGESAKVANVTNVSLATSTANEYNGQVYGLDLKYANEFNGLRVAGGIGYEHSELDFSTVTSSGAGLSPFAQRIDQIGAALSFLHVPTGLFIQGDYISSRRANVDKAVAGEDVAYRPDVTASRFWLQAGISRNWHGYGNTNLVAEFGIHRKWAEANLQDHNFGSDYPKGAVVLNGGDNKFYGLGMVQNFDAAALELYSGWRHYSTDDATLLSGGSTSFKDVDVFHSGMRIKF
jgi:hypothetical protein